MSLIRFRKDPDLFSAFPSFFDDSFGRDLARGFATGTSMPAVNIAESDDQFEVEVAAPGLTKEDFKVAFENGVLTISAEKKDEKEEKTKTHTRREFSYSSFQRSFTVPDSVQADKIGAEYKDGVLRLALPKHDHAKRQAKQEIAVR